MMTTWSALHYVLLWLLLAAWKSVSSQGFSLRPWSLPQRESLFVVQCQTVEKAVRPPFPASVLGGNELTTSPFPKCVDYFNSGVCVCTHRGDAKVAKKKRTRVKRSFGNDASAFFPRTLKSLDTDVVTALSGRPAKLICPLFSSISGDVSWDKGDTKIPHNHRQQVQRDGTLIISNVQKKTDEGIYNCAFTDSRGIKHSNKVILKVIDPPVINHFEFRTDMQVGMQIKVFCTVVQGDAPYFFTWLKDGVRVDLSMDLNVTDKNDYSMLSTKSLQLRHAGNYTCVVRNEGSTTSYSAILRVNQQPVWQEEPSHTVAIQGQNVLIKCSASGSPQPTITWMIVSSSPRNEFLPLYNSHKYALYPNGSLAIHQVEPEDSGTYLCKASNGFGVDLSKRIFLTIRRPPKFDIKFQAHTVKRGEKARLQCVAQGDLPINLTWSTLKEKKISEKNSKFKVLKTENQTTSAVSSVLLVTTESVEDSGIYSCVATNAYGTDEANMRLLVQEVPGPPLNVTVANTTGSSLLITWPEPFRGNSAISKYKIQFREAGTEDSGSLQEVTTNGTSIVLSNLRPARVYSLRVKAENGVGWGPFSEWITAPTDEDSPSSPPINITARATGPNSIKITWEPPPEDSWNGRIKGYKIKYSAVSSDQTGFKSIEVRNPNQRHETHLTNLKRSEEYAVAVQAFTGKGDGPFSQIVSVKTLADVPPSPPTLQVMAVSSSTVTLKWTQKTAFGNPVAEYYLYYRKDKGEWKMIEITTTERQYVVEGLDCGTAYEFYMVAFNTLGRSEPSDTVRNKTDGAPPRSPLREDFIQVGERYADLLFRNWKSGGCPISHFTLKVRMGQSSSWNTLNSNISANQSNFLVKNLIPGMLYNVHVVAVTSAGSTEAQYEFATQNGSISHTKADSAASVPKKSTLPSVTDPEILIPIVASGLVVLVVIVVGCVLCSRDSLCVGATDGGRLTSRYSEEAVAMKELASPPECGSDEGLQRSSAHYLHGQTLYGQRTEAEEEGNPYAMPYDVLVVSRQRSQSQGQLGTVEKNKERRTSNTYVSRQSLTNQNGNRDRPYESLMVNINTFPKETLDSSDLRDVEV